MARAPRRSPAGFTLIEVMIALGLLLFGLVGMLKLQLMGMGANHAARAHTAATQVARELVAGLERVPLDAAVLTANGAGATAPGSFGPLATGPAARADGAHVYDDATPLPGTRTNAQLAAESAAMTYDRRWTVWDYEPDTVTSAGAGTSTAAKIVAVSVRYTYHQTGPGGEGSGEVVLYLQRANPALFLGNVSAYR